MANFIKASESAVVNLEGVAAITHDASGFNSVSGQAKSVTIHLAGAQITVLERDPNYQLWLDFMDRQNSLLSTQDQQRQNIVDGVFNPFVETDKLTAIYSLFNEIPDHSSLMLCLEDEDHGSIRRKEAFGIPGVSIVVWQSAIEAVDRLHAYRDALAEHEDIS